MASRLYGGARNAYIRARRGTDSFDLSRVADSPEQLEDYMMRNTFLLTDRELNERMETTNLEQLIIIQSERQRRISGSRHRPEYEIVRAHIIIETARTLTGGSITDGQIAQLLHLANLEQWEYYDDHEALTETIGNAIDDIMD